jgi:hypothetical protein
MTLSGRVRAACDTLGLDIEAQEDEAMLRRSYRAALRAHPPDRDPDGFRRIREAYELLRAPVGASRALLATQRPLVPPPQALPVEPYSPGSTAVALLRLAVMRLSVDELVPEVAGQDSREEQP